MAEVVGIVKGQLEMAHHPDGYNLGFNDGAAAGQTVFHAHLHVIPRFDGDVKTSPRFAELREHIWSLLADEALGAKTNEDGGR